MKRFILEQSDDEFYTSHSGLALAGLCINRYSELSWVAGRKMKKNTHLISHSDLLRSYLGLLCLGKSDYEAVTEKRDDDHFKSALGIITNVPSVERLRQRLDEHAQEYLTVAHKCSVTLLKKGKAHLTALDTGHIPLDADVFPMDNSRAPKKKMSAVHIRAMTVMPPLLHILAWKDGVSKLSSVPAVNTAGKDLFPSWGVSSQKPEPLPGKNCWFALTLPTMP